MKKLLISFLIFTLLLGFVSPTFVAAQGTTNVAPTTGKWWRPTFEEFNNKVEDGDVTEIFGERYTQAQVYWIFASLMNIVSGAAAACGKVYTTAAATPGDPTAVQSVVNCLTSSLGPTTDRGAGSPILAIGAMSDLIMKTHPASGISYVAEKIQNFGFPTANAQGFGFQTLAPARALWTATRNAAYALMTLAILVIAFLIMLRVKISPQAVITAQSALPKIVFGLILITFSYAIAGFIIDLTYVFQGIVSLILQGSGVIRQDQSAIQILASMQQTTSGIMAYGAITLLQFTSGTGVWASIFGQSSIAVVADLIIGIILLVVMLIAAVRLMFTLLKTYVTLILLIIAGPLIILWSVISPGGSVTGWIKQIVANASVFATVGFLIMLAHILFWSSNGRLNWLAGAGCGGGNQAVGAVLLNPYLICTIPMAGGTGVVPSFNLGMDMLGFLGALVLMISIPSYANGVKNMITGARADYGSDLTGAAGMAGGFAGGGAGMGVNAAIQSQSGGPLGIMNRLGVSAGRLAGLEADLKGVDARMDPVGYADALQRLQRAQSRQKMIQNLPGLIPKRFK